MPPQFTILREQPAPISDSPAISALRNKKLFSLVIFTIAILAIGFIGGLSGLVAIANNPKLARFLGVSTPEVSPSTSEVGKTISQRLVVEQSSAVIDVVKKVSPAVVSIIGKSQVTDFFGFTIPQEGRGSGFIITSDGLILTNKHVVGDENAEYTVFTADGKNFLAKVLDRHPTLDLAIIKIEASSLPVLVLGDSEKLQVGEWVVAIGNALGEFENTVTVGVISAKDRVLKDSTDRPIPELTGLIQTDAAINQGNSGGPLLNLSGQVIGINTATAPKGVGEGIGFAIPINAGKSAIESVKKSGKIVTPYLGVRYLPIDKRVAKLNNLPVDYGALVLRSSPTEVAVIPGSPADQAGIKENDIILEINGDRIDENHSLATLLLKYNVGDKVTLKYLREGKEATTEVTLEERK
jgi:serine protease Do